VSSGSSSTTTASGKLKKVGKDLKKAQDAAEKIKAKLILAEFPLFLVCLRAGLRLGEALALEWSDLNWREGYILVQRSFRNGRTTPTKNGRLRRVDMTDQLISVLRKLNLKRRVDIYGHILPTENRNILNSLDTPNRTLYAPSKNEKAATR